MPSRKKFMGQEPAAGELVARIGDGWRLYQLSQPSGAAQWIKLKLAFDGMRKAKANYWLSWSVVEHRFGVNKDYVTLAQYEPSVLQELVGYLLERFPLVDADGVDLL